jgi:hypothetical protein
MNDIETLSPENAKEVRATHNFWTRLPDDHYPLIPGVPLIRSGWFRVDVYEQGKLDQLIYFDPTYRYMHSDLFLQQTWRSHFLRIDELIAEFHCKDPIQSALNIGWEPDRIAALEKAKTIAIGDDRIPLEKRLRALIVRSDLNRWRDTVSLLALPIYKHLLAEGYTEYDLTR